LIRETHNEAVKYLSQALEAAETRRGFCAPNPAVGAVVVKAGTVLAVGSHWAAGYPHAEVEALKNLKSEAEGATIYVTLEPCCMYGRTPPCTSLLIERRIGRVVYGYADPDARVSGRGAALLREAGIECELVEIPAIQSFYESYRYWQQTRLPFVTAKLAMSLDGKTALEGGEPVRLTGLDTDVLTHQFRKRADALLTTARTIASDDPSLNARLGDAVIAKPVYVLDTRATLSPQARIFTTASSVTVFHSAKADTHRLEVLKNAGAHLVTIAESLEGLDWTGVMQALGKNGVQDLWVEAGGRSIESLSRTPYLKRAYLYVAPRWLGERAHLAFERGPDALFSKATRLRWSGSGQDAVCEVTL
jgi:diaminohydroxyphosphoribosylaminopyrimidine deaminase/5-amino-6-(5-phosphoribosylamino)uracil reductase